MGQCWKPFHGLWSHVRIYTETEHSFHINLAAQGAAQVNWFRLKYERLEKKKHTKNDLGYDFLSSSPAEYPIQHQIC